MCETKVRDWKDKLLHGAFVRDIEETAVEESWRWLRNGYLKKGTEGMICAAQEQALRTNSIKCYIDKTNDSPLCRLYEKSSEIAWHVVSGCSNIAQKEYKKRHDKVALRVHWELRKKYDLECGEKWYEHQPVIENEQVKLVWDGTIVIDRRVPLNRPETTIV